IVIGYIRILLNLPAHQVVRVCRLVCYEWKELCRREGFQPCDASRPLDDWCLFYFITKKGSNLLKNPRANGHKHTTNVFWHEMDTMEINGNQNCLVMNLVIFIYG
uniref:F-box domain-containing protein n=1 Tax=Sinocyclocheilus rhinocerous TaxID=307959 RepID=A0A673FLZ1_9TELE